MDNLLNTNEIIDTIITNEAIKQAIYDSIDTLVEQYISEDDDKKEDWFNKDNSKFIDKDDETKDAKYDADKLRQVEELLDTKPYNGAEIARELYNIPDDASEDEQGAARSLFSKKKRGFKNENGYEYGFTPLEVNKLIDILK